MKTRPKFSDSWSSSLGLPAVFMLCLFFFFLGFFGSYLFSQQVDTQINVHPKPKVRVLSETDYGPLPHGESGDDSFTNIPFQVLSWSPRALYFLGFGFATDEQCDEIIKMAKVIPEV